MRLSTGINDPWQAGLSKFYKYDPDPVPVSIKFLP